MTSKQISLGIIEACKASEDLNAYIASTYPTKTLTYARGLNLDIDYYSENGYSDVPIVILDPEVNTVEQDGNKNYGMVLHIKVVHEDEFKTGFAKVDNVITLDGIDEIEEICGFISTAVTEYYASRGDIDIEGTDTYLDPVAHVSNFTEYNGHIVISFTIDATIGAC